MKGLIEPGLVEITSNSFFVITAKTKSLTDFFSKYWEMLTQDDEYYISAKLKQE